MVNSWCVTCNRTVSSIALIKLITLVFRAIFHSPELYPSPEEFIPERFDPSGGEKSQVDPEILAFGLGRR